MKFRFTLLIALLFILVLNGQKGTAQITISDSDYASPLGDTIVNYNTNLFNVFSPSEGSNQSWDYRWLELLNAQNDPEPEISDTNFPTANNVDEIPVTTVFNAEATVPVRFFERYDTEGKALLGREVAAPTVIPFDCATCTAADSIRFEPVINSYEEPEQVLRLPLNFGDSWSSSHTATIDMTLFSPTFSLNDVPAQQIDSVEVESEVTGWGTLTLPNLTRSGFQDMEALLVRRTRTVSSYFYLNGAPAPQALLDQLGLTQGQEVVTTEFHFYAQGLDRPALSLTFGANGFPLAASITGKISEINPEEEGQFFPVGTLHDGNPRAYYVYLPPGYTGAEPAPVVVGLHGYTSYATQFAWQSQLNAIADTAGFIVVYPQGLLIDNAREGGPLPPRAPGWNVPDGPFNSGTDDVDFINSVVENVANQFNVDLSRVYATGISNGGFMTSALACALPERFAAVAMGAGVIPCERNRPIPTFIIHGTDDLLVPYTGAPDLSLPPVPEIVTVYAEQNGCTATPDSTDLPDIDPNDGTTITKFTYSGCQEDAEVVLYRVNNGGHVWEGTGPVPPLFQPILGAFVNQDIHAGSEIWNFFNRHQHPDPAGVAQLLEKTITVDGLEREYLLYVPAAYDGSEAWPLVFNLHGAGSNAGEQAFLSVMQPVADTAHFLIAYPDGLLNLEGTTGWNVFSSPELQDDVKFISELIDDIASGYQVDLARVYTSGLSNGAGMSLTLGDKLSDRIAAVAAVAHPARLPGFDDFPILDPGRPLPILSIHGTADLVVPFEGGQSAIPFIEVTFPDSRESIQYWVDYNNCGGEPEITEFPDINTADNSTVTLERYANCDAGTEIAFYVIDNGGHTWPGGAPVPPGLEILGNVNRDISASSEIWNFFNRFNLQTTSLPTLSPSELDLQVFPNPFSTQLTFTFELPEAARVQLSIFNQLGQEVQTIADQRMAKGAHRVEWNTAARQLPAGMYYYRLRVGDRFVSQPVVLERVD